MARAPSAGGKTRLTRDLSDSSARTLREALFLDTLDAVRPLRVPITVFGTPGDRLDELRTLAGEVAILPQADGDLGARMQAACACLFGQGARRVVLIGSDLPTLPSSHVIDAFEALEAGADMTLGPADDGGYYLIGLGRPSPALFAGISWGSECVLEETRAAAAGQSLRVHEIVPWYDVDGLDDLRRVSSSQQPAARTRAWLAEGSRQLSWVDGPTGPAAK
jgi:rSAM/selenodomain-associated transferase 1